MNYFWNLVLFFNTRNCMKWFNQAYLINFFKFRLRAKAIKKNRGEGKKMSILRGKPIMN